MRVRLPLLASLNTKYEKFFFIVGELLWHQHRGLVIVLPSEDIASWRINVYFLASKSKETLSVRDFLYRLDLSKDVFKVRREAKNCFVYTSKSLRK